MNLKDSKINEPNSEIKIDGPTPLFLMCAEQENLVNPRMSNNMSVTFTGRFCELCDEDKVCIINLINTMASFKGVINFKDGIKKMKKELIEEWRVGTADSDDEDEEDEEEWDDVYAMCPIQDFTSDEVFKVFHNKKNTFYQIMGGGWDITGWIADDNNNVWYAFKDSCGNKWKYELTEYKRVEVREEDKKNGITKAVRVL